MDYDDATAFRQDLEQRLEERAGGDKVRFARACADVVFERLLVRFLAVVPGQWSLAGDFALDLRLAGRVRKGRSLNIEWPVGGHSEFREVPFKIARHDPGDLFELELEQSGMGVSGGSAWSHTGVHAFLAGRPFSTVSLEIALRYGQLPTEPVRTDGLLGFAGIEPVEVNAVLLEMQAAEMFYEYCRECETGLNPTRADGLLDIGLIAGRDGLDAANLRGAIDGIFAHKEVEPPTSLPNPFEGWAEPLRQMAQSAGPPAAYLAGYDSATALFDPVLSGEVVEGAWDAGRQRWGDPSSNGHSSSSSAQT